MKQIKLKFSYEAPTMESVEIHAENCILIGSETVGGVKTEVMDVDDDELDW